MFTTIFENGILKVFRDGVPIIIQPFKPTSTGDQLVWANEEDALAWWQAIKSLYDNPIIAEEQFPATDQ